MNDEIRKRVEELRSEDEKLIEQEKLGRNQVAEIQRALAEINGRRVSIFGAVTELEKLIKTAPEPRKDLKITEKEAK